MCVCSCMCAIAHECHSEDTPCLLDLSLYHVVPGDWTQGIRQTTCPQSYLSSLILFLIRAWELYIICSTCIDCVRIKASQRVNLPLLTFILSLFNILTSVCSGMLYMVVTYAHFRCSTMSQAASNSYHPALSDNELEVQKAESSYPRFPACPSIWKQGHALFLFLRVFSKAFFKGLVASSCLCTELPPGSMWVAELEKCS